MKHLIAAAATRRLFWPAPGLNATKPLWAEIHVHCIAALFTSLLLPTTLATLFSSNMVCHDLCSIEPHLLHHCAVVTALMLVAFPVCCRSLFPNCPLFGIDLSSDVSPPARLAASSAPFTCRCCACQPHRRLHPFLNLTIETLTSCQNCQHHAILASNHPPFPLLDPETNAWVLPVCV